ncbi:hypothetical protein JCM4914_39550 [Streptomyces platensis subsp. malvinus]
MRRRLQYEIPCHTPANPVRKVITLLASQPQDIFLAVSILRDADFFTSLGLRGGCATYKPYHYAGRTHKEKHEQAHHQCVFHRLGHLLVFFAARIPGILERNEKWGDSSDAYSSLSLILRSEIF